jgi:membrane protein implicated in regulation of membrane protease activity
VVILWTWTAVLSGFVLYPTLTGSNPAYLPFAMAALAIVLYTILHPSVRARRREDIEAALAAMDARAAAARGDTGDVHPDVVDDPDRVVDAADVSAVESRLGGSQKPGIGSDAGLPTADLDH